MYGGLKNAWFGEREIEIIDEGIHKRRRGLKAIMERIWHAGDELWQPTVVCNIDMGAVVRAFRWISQAIEPGLLPGEC